MSEETMTALDGIDLDVASLETLEELSLEDLLGIDIGDIDLRSSMPDGVYLGYLSNFEKKIYAAKPEEGKKASVQLMYQLKIRHVVKCGDPDVDASSLVGRSHVASYPLTQDWGQKNLVKLVLGAMGVSFRDTAAQASIGRSVIDILTELREHQVAFGFTIKNSERNGYENCDVVLKEPSFIPMERAEEMLAELEAQAA